MGKLPAKQRLTVGQTIEVNHRPVFSTEEGPNWSPATVEDLLSDTFTFFYQETGRVGWCFYNDEDSSWRIPA